jgi:hypothetical protein
MNISRYLIMIFIIWAVVESKPFESSAENLVDNILLKAQPEEIKNITCPVHINFLALIQAGDNIYKTDSLLLKYRLIGDNNYVSDWYEYSIRKGGAKSDIFRRRIDPVTLLKHNNLQNNPYLTIVGDTAFYNGWSVLEVVYQNKQRRVFKGYSDKAKFSIECKLHPNIYN